MMYFKLNPIIPLVLVAVVAVVLGLFFFLNKGQARISMKIFLVYLAVALLCFSLQGLLGFIKIENALPYFLMLQSLFLVLGISHCTALYLLNSESQRLSFWHEFVFTMLLGIFGMVIFYFIFGLTSRSEFTVYFLSGFFFFFIPFFILKAFDYLIAIPSPEYPMFYPVSKEFEEATEEDIDDRFIILLKFNLERADGSESFITPTYKSPLRAIFGEHFSRFLYDYNDANPSKQIQYQDNYGQPVGWNFYVKPKRWFHSPRYIDPNLTINENDLKDSDIIICERIKT